MKKLIPAMLLGLALVVAVLWLLGPRLTPIARAQGGTGFVRVALTGTDTSGCGSVALPCATVQFAIDEAIPGEEILIAAGTYAGVQVRNGLTQTVYISKPLILRGGYTTTDGFATSNPVANPTILNAQSNGRVILITETVAASLENLTVTGGFVDGLNLCTGNNPSCGGGIFATGPLTLNNVNVLGNQSSRFGGGVAALTTTVVNNSRFENNAGLSGFSDGGGLYAEGPVTISNSDFISNTADGGGGVQIVQASVQVVNSTFERNTARNGGGMSVSVSAGNAQTLQITNTTFINNSATCQSFLGICNGGGVYAFDVPVTIVGSRFENNSVQDLFDNDDGNGGGIYLSGAFNVSTLTLVSTDFISNSAQLEGGGAYANDQTFVTGGRFERNFAGGNVTAFSDGGGGLRALSAVVDGTQFIQNSSDENGAGIHVRLDADVTNAQFQFNRAITNGGGIYTGVGGTLALTNTQFFSNSANDGGGAYSAFGVVTLNGGQFEQNEALNSGGGLYVNQNLLLNNNTQFVGNVAQESGGGAYVAGNADLNGGSFENNQAFGTSVFGSGGGGIHVLGNLTFADTIFNSNTATRQGGGARVIGTVDGTNGMFTQNQVGNVGGGLAAFGNTTLTGTQLTGNKVISTSNSFGGGGAMVDNETVLTNVLFQNNTSEGSISPGGGLRTEVLTATNTQFIGNTAASNGGGASVVFGSVSLNNVLFDSNTSNTSSGGGLSAFVGFNEMNIANSQFFNNTADINGGGLSLSGAFFITDTLIQNNRALNGSGGGLYTASRANFGGNWEVSNNSAAGDGGGIWANSGLNSTNGRIENNSSGRSGGGFYGGLGSLTVNGTVFANNQAGGGDGGGAYAFNANAVGNALFDSNTATGAGGGLFLQRFVHITTTQFLGNDANLGGGLAISRTNTGSFVQFVHNSLFARNTATTSGAGIYWNQPRPINLIHNTIASPGATAGAAIHIVTGTVNITNNIIANHTTGIQVVSGAVTENYNLFSGNTTNTSGPVGGGVGSLTGNPAFQNPANDDYHLSVGSAAVDQGINAGITEDFDGDVRPANSGFDMGYDEADFNVELTISKLATPSANAPYRGEITYTVVLSNDGGLNATNTTFTDTLPTEVDFNRWVQQPAGATVTTDEIGWQGTVPANGQVTFTFVVSHVGTYGDVVNNTAEYSHVSSGNTAGATFTVEPDPSGGPPAGDIYLPIIMANAGSSPPPPPSPPDLIVDSLAATSAGITVTVKNIGAGPVVDAFWVDVYINPDPPPTGVNQPWKDLGDEGMAWGVVGAGLSALTPGGTLTLTIGSPYYNPSESSFSLPLAQNDPVYAQVDSINFATTYGNVPESNEGNNISSTSVSAVAGSVTAVSINGGPEQPADAELPARWR